MKRIAAAALVALVLAGCGTKIEVSSDTSWTGYVNDHSVAGSGGSSYSVGNGQSAVFQKATSDGVLRARVKGWGGDGRWVSTDAPYGVVSVTAE